MVCFGYTELTNVLLVVVHESKKTKKLDHELSTTVKNKAGIYCLNDKNFFLLDCMGY